MKCPLSVSFLSFTLDALFLVARRAGEFNWILVSDMTRYSKKKNIKKA